MFHFRFLTFLLPFLILVSVHASPRLERVENNLIADQQSPLNDASQKILPLDLRSLSDWKLSNLLLVSDIDGNLHGVERKTGAFLWSLPIDEPLVKILKSDAKSATGGSESNLLWFVEPAHDGSLYYFSPLYGLNKLPTSIKDLVMESPFSLSGDNKIYTGARKTSLYTINLHTGQIISQFGSSEEEECPVPNVYETPRFASGGNENIIMIGKTTYELSIHSKLDSNLVWNVTYSQWGPNNIDNDLIMQHVQSIDNLYFTPFYDKSLLAINREIGTPSWISKLPSLAVNVFDIFNNKDEFVALPHPSKVLNDLQLVKKGASDYANNDLCFLNRTANGKEWFAMSFPNYPTLLKLAPVSQYQMALYKYDNGVLDETLVGQLSDFDVSVPEADLYISGVHKINHLGPANLYRPVSKFNRVTRQIGDGSDSPAAEPPKPTDEQLQQVPSLMDGILFPNTPEEFRNDLSTLDRDGNDLYHDTGYHPEVPADYIIDNSKAFKTDTHKLSVFRRIAEDLLVMSALLLFLLAFGKVNQIVKNKAEPLLKSLNNTVKIDQADMKHYSEIKNIPLAAELAEESSEDTLSEEKVKSAVKKVTIVVPENTGSEDSTSTAVEQVSSDKFAEDEDIDAPGTKKKRKRGSRGGKRGGKGKKSVNKEDDESKLDILDSRRDVDDKSDQADDDEDASDTLDAIPTKSLVKDIIRPSAQLKKLQIDNNLVISDKILGYGSHGTVVYEGSFENRPVAVKRMLLDFYDIANHEVRLLQESDDHPNVVRYFCSQSSESEKFLYIALELCVCSLEDIIEKQISYPKTLWINLGSYSEVLLQLVSGLNYLHSLKIVHRDLKPQNILVGESSRKNAKREQVSTVRLLISDFGLCKKLDADQSSFRATTQHAASGTSGWRAPELLLHHDLSEISPDSVSSFGSTSRHSMKEGALSHSSGQGKRLTKAIDIFSLGCVFYYILAEGGHPFGDRYLREGNIIRGEYDLSPLIQYCPDDYVEATDLIQSMISFNPKSRPDTLSILKHPYFWNYNQKLEFMLKVSDRFEIERRDPPSDLLLKLELIGEKVHNNDWLSKFDNVFKENLGKYRKYNTDKVMDLLRALRNKYHHYNDMPEELQSQMKPLPHGFYRYFNRKFPYLLMEIYYVVKANLNDEHVFQEYF